MANSEYQNNVIIGASIAGHTVANRLCSALPASMRAAVVPGWEDKITVPLTTAHVFPSGKDHVVLAPNKVIELRKNSVILQNAFEGSTELRFYKCVLSTGCAQPAPLRPKDPWSEDDFRNALKEAQEGIAKANKIVVVGGGPVGVEFAAEVRHIHPEKEITIVHKDIGLLAPTPTSTQTVAARIFHSSHDTYITPVTNTNLSKRLGELTREMNIKLILEDRVVIPSAQTQAPNAEQWDGTPGLMHDGPKVVSLKSGRKIEADYVFFSTGNKPNIELVKLADQSALAGNYVAVDGYLKITAKDDESGKSPFGKGDYYAAGDITNFPGRKISSFATEQAAAVAKNIVQKIKGRPLIKCSIPYGDVQGIILGPENGAGAFDLPYLGTWMIGGTVMKYMFARTLGVERQWKSLWKGQIKV